MACSDTSPGSIRELLGRSQRLLPQSQHVQAGVEIAVQHHATTGTGVGPISEREQLPMSALGAILRRVRGVHSHEGSTGPCCLVGQQGCELTPGGVMDALSEAVGMYHAVDGQVLHRNQVKGVDDMAALYARTRGRPPCAVPPTPASPSPLQRGGAAPWPAPSPPGGKSGGWPPPRPC